MSYLNLGQFRKVEYLDDGVSQFQCMWCKGYVQIRDNPNYWNFCPLCGKSWFKRMETRPHHVPRWFWERYGEDPDCKHQMHGSRPEPTSKWVIEKRSKLSHRDWSDWYEYVSCTKDPCKPDWQWARGMLVDRRNHNPGDDDIKYEYRARIKKLV